MAKFCFVCSRKLQIRIRLLYIVNLFIFERLLNSIMIGTNIFNVPLNIIKCIFVLMELFKNKRLTHQMHHSHKDYSPPRGYMYMKSCTYI